MQGKSFNLENLNAWLGDVRAGDIISISGRAYAFRDQAHKRLIEMIKRNEILPIDLKNKAVYYVGPTPPDKSGKVLAAGPTTTRRMEKFLPVLLNLGQRALIGKGELSRDTCALLKQYGAVYLVPVGGAAAFLATKIEKMTPIEFLDLGPEAIYEVVFKNFPVIVAFDRNGNNAFKMNL